VSQDLADTGASVSATGIKQILHDFTTDTKFKITGYDGTQKNADGQGMARIFNRATGKIDEMLFVYGQEIDGTIISLEHHARTNPQIHRWSQEATPSQESGWITFYNKHNDVLAKYPTTRRQGLYYIQELEFIPVPDTNETQGVTLRVPACTHAPTETVDINGTTVAHIRHVDTENQDAENSGVRMSRSTRDNASEVGHESDFSIDIESEHFQYLLGTQISTTNPIRMDTTISTTHCRPSSLEKDVIQYHTWHQRSHTARRQNFEYTQKCVDGIPPFHHNKIPQLVTCRACDIAKLHKAPKGHTIDEHTPPTARANISDGHRIHTWTDELGSSSRSPGRGASKTD
jgi:hypothetical protein